MAYSIEIKRSAEKELRKLPKETISRIVEAMQGLKEEPRPKQSRKLKDTEHTYRLRVGDYRVVYQIYDDEKKVVVFHIRHRKDAYRGVP